MSKMPLYVHSKGRANSRLITLRFMPPEFRDEHVTLVVQPQEEKDYRVLYPNMEYLVLPEGIDGLSPTRQFLIDNAVEEGIENIVMMDDDLMFITRKGRENNQLRDVRSYEDFHDMFELLESWLKNGYAHVGLSERGNNIHIDGDWKEPGRMTAVLGYNIPLVARAGARFDRILTKQDFDMTLQLLRKGYPNRVSFVYAHDHRMRTKSDNGGCASYRTVEVMSKDSHKLAELHPGFVKVVTKQTKFIEQRKVEYVDVRIQWKKAYKSSQGAK